MPFPDIDPVLLQLGPLAIRWYALAYVVGVLLGWWYVARLDKRGEQLLTQKAFDDILVWAIIGIVLGGRLGYVLFYNFPYYMAYPQEIFMVWHGGMAFHGGLIGVIVSMYLFCRRHKIPFLELMDLIAPAAPIGLFFGRIANFINGELYGRVTDVAWAVRFPAGGYLPRHPSQLYEAVMEGLLLFVILWFVAWYSQARKQPGVLSGIFLIGYATARMVSELFRVPDALIVGDMSIGQFLSLPMLLLGLYLYFRGIRQRIPAV